MSTPPPLLYDAAKSWRDILPVHEAAELLPPMPPDELRALGEDIKQHGLRDPIMLYGGKLLDGRCRLDAMQQHPGIELEMKPWREDNTRFDVIANVNLPWESVKYLAADADPVQYVLSKNLYRRHLTPEQRRDLIAKVLKASPEKSNRQLAEIVKASHVTVGAVRAELESTGQIDQLEKTIGKDKRARTTAPKSRETRVAETAIQAAGNAVDRAESAEQRKAEAAGDEQHGDDEAEPPRRGFVTGVAMAPYSERSLDCYETPAVAVRALIEAETLIGPIWEPAAGRGAIVRVLREAGHHVVATDVRDYGCADARGGIDFLSESCAPEGVGTILTNPPFRLANKFVRHALKLAPRVIMLLPLRFLESEGRRDILDGGQLARVLPFRNRLPMMHRAGWRGSRIKTGAIAFSWFSWDREHRGPPTIHRISWRAELPEERQS